MTLNGQVWRGLLVITHHSLTPDCIMSFACDPFPNVDALAFMFLPVTLNLQVRRGLLLYIHQRMGRPEREAESELQQAAACLSSVSRQAMAALVSGEGCVGSVEAVWVGKLGGSCSRPRSASAASAARRRRPWCQVRGVWGVWRQCGGRRWAEAAAGCGLPEQYQPPGHGFCVLR